MSYARYTLHYTSTLCAECVTHCVMHYTRGSPSTVRNQRHPYWHTWVFPGSNPGSRKDKNLKHNAVLRVRLRHPSPLGGSLGRRVGYGPVNQGNRREVASARLENKGAPPGRWGQGGTWYTYLDVSFCVFALYFLTSVVRR